MLSTDSYTAFLFLGFIFLTILFGLLFFKPKQGLFFLILLRPVLDNINAFRTFRVPGIGLNIWQMVGIAIPCCMIFVCLVKKMDISCKPFYFFRHSFLNAYFLFLIFCLPSIYITASSLTASAAWLRLFTLWAVVIYADYALETRKDATNLLYVFVLSSLYPLGRLMVDLLSGTRVEMGGYMRLTGGYFHMSILSTMLMFFIPAYLYFFFKKVKYNHAISLMSHKLFYAGGILLILMFIYLTNYRTAFLSVISLLFIFLLFRKKFMWATLFVGATIFAIMSVPTLRDRFMPLMIVLPNLDLLFDSTNTTYDNYLSGRFGIWRKILTTFLYDSTFANFVFGYGTDPRIAKIQMYGHNDMLYFMFHYGLLPLFFFYTFLFKLVKLSFHYTADLIPQLITSLFIALIVSSLSHPTFFDVRNLLFMGGYITVLIKFIDTLPGEKASVKTLS